MRVAVIGRGKLGRTLARALRAAHVEHVLVRAHPLGRTVPRCDVYVLAVPDGRIAEVATALVPHVAAKSVALHCAGARDASELSPLRERGVASAVFHPLVSFAAARGRSTLAGATFTLHGDERAVRAGSRIARRLGAHAVVLGRSSVPEAALYHAAAALVANGAAALADHGVGVLAGLGFSRREAELAISGLLASVAENVREMGVPAALTGPVVRGDVATVERHLKALRRADDSARRAYAGLLPTIVATAKRAGLEAQRARTLEALVRKR